MSTFLSHGCSILVNAHCLRRRLFAAALLLPAILLADNVQAQDFLRTDRGVARNWALHQIAVIQAAGGDINGAQNTAALIGAADIIPGKGDVTGVSFCNGQPIYDRPPTPNQSECRERWIVLNSDRPPDHVPPTVPQGLPASYFAADPHHGALVNFTDEQDCHGTRVTSRRYANGSIVIETPRVEKNR